ncbi:MAG TPA: ATP-binding cassette domain-containing protein [Saprospiraceae bacterium]|nr:ATP-binding cassette domain-containing protein [Saprospiraceae bacterium]HPQ20434.1 ATP-binding cassette domain-containing protein [Saprospiraceae bacterium]
MNNPIISYKDVTLRQDDHVVLENLNFSLQVAEQCYIIGESGSGKSTFIKSMYAEVPISTGNAQVLNYSLESIKRNDVPMLRRQLGIIFQNFYLFENWTVIENLIYVLKATDWKNKEDMANRAEEVLDRVGLLQYKNNAAYKLSGGEKQKLAIARAILNHPKLIIADEPTGNLDPNTSDDIIYLLHNLASAHKTAIIFATHDYRLLEKFPARVYKCVDKGLIET